MRCWGIVKCNELDRFLQLSLWNSFPAQVIVISPSCTSGLWHRAVVEDVPGSSASKAAEQGSRPASGQWGVQPCLEVVTCLSSPSVPLLEGCTGVACLDITDLRNYLTRTVNTKVKFPMVKEHKERCRFCRGTWAVYSQTQPLLGSKQHFPHAGNMDG